MQWECVAVSEMQTGSVCRKGTMAVFLHTGETPVFRINPSNDSCSA